VTALARPELTCTECDRPLCWSDEHAAFLVEHYDEESAVCGTRKVTPPGCRRPRTVPFAHQPVTPVDDAPDPAQMRLFPIPDPVPAVVLVELWAHMLDSGRPESTEDGLRARYGDRLLPGWYVRPPTALVLTDPV
jgi:hypothetical protein